MSVVCLINAVVTQGSLSLRFFSSTYVILLRSNHPLFTTFHWEVQTRNPILNSEISWILKYLWISILSTARNSPKKCITYSPLKWATYKLKYLWVSRSLYSISYHLSQAYGIYSCHRYTKMDFFQTRIHFFISLYPVESLFYSYIWDQASSRILKL